MRMIPRLIKSSMLTIVLLMSFLFGASLWAQTSPAAEEDSVLNKYSIEDLVKLKKALEQEKARLIKKQEQDRQRGVELSKDFLSQTREENENQDMILIRVAEYYIEEAYNKFEAAVEEYNRRYDEYEKQLDKFNQGKLKAEPVAPKFPQRNFEQPIALYDLILANFPESELADDALYNKAFLLGEMEEEKASQETFLELIDKYPESEYAPEAYIQLAEYYFQPRLGQNREETIRNLNKAAQLYKNVLNYKDSPRYDEALYKLGWSYYRLAGAEPDYYNDAILYFTAVVQDVERFKKMDPEGKYIKANIEPEALQYIAASFVDTSYTKDGVGKASGFIEKLGQPEFGVDIMSHMGDLYARIVDYDNSIRAYHRLLEMYPNYAHAPMIRKKISDVYLEAKQYELAYEERANLFKDYNQKSTWYAKYEQEDRPDRIVILDEASRLTEEALRSNLIYQLEQARNFETAKGDSIAAYTKFVELGKQYLENFPTNDNAYEINWSLAYVLDTELHKYKDAFEQYIRVSNDYLEETHREDAAVNAIVVAQSLVNLARATGDTTQLESTNFSQMTAQEFTPEEKLLAEAFDNYIKLFPNQPKTASYLASAGALYYQHRQYDLARKYYKTMVTKFPEAQQRSVGLLSLMNSYFFLGKYEDAEFVAKKIVSSEGLPEDQLEVARKRIGESIFKNAEKLEQEEQFLASAREFYRVYTDAAYYQDIVDLALFNSGMNFERAEEWQQAIATYDTLVENFTDSKYRAKALGREADAYKQMEDFAGVGRSYERIYQLNPQGEDAQAALYNSSLFYAKADAFADAIRINNMFITNYPDNPDSKDLLFENARYYLKLDDLESANRIYSDFASRYPDDKRTIEAFHRRGEYYFEREQFDLAKAEFQKAINKSNEYARTGRDPNLFFASESYFKLGEIEFEEFKNIKLSYPPSNLRTQLRTKQDKLLSVVNAFTKVIQMGSLKGFEAMYKVAEAYEVMGQDVGNQQLPPNLTPAQELVERDRAFKASVPAYDRAVEEYKNVIKNIPILAEKLDISLTDTAAAPEPAPLEDTTSVVEKITLQDSTREVALRWYNRAEEKISRILYNVAENSSQFIDRYLREENPATGTVYLSWKKLLLERAISPAIGVTLNAHLKNINSSAEMQLDNKYVHESERKILLTSNILADEYGRLVKKAVDIYENDIGTLKSLIDGGETATTPDGLNSLDYNDQMMSVIDYMNEFQTIAINQYNNTLKFAADNQINNDAVLTTQDRLFNLAYENSKRMLDMADRAVAERTNYETLSDSTGDTRYQLGIVYFDDQQSILRQYALQSLKLSYEISKNFDVENVWTTLILAKLVELEPAEYLGDLPKEKFIITSDTTWLVSDIYDLSWIEANFDDSGWKKSAAVPLPIGMVFSGFDEQQVNPTAIWVYAPPPIAPLQDSLIIQDTTSQPADTLRPRSLEMEDKEIPEEELQTPVPIDTLPGVAAGPVEPDTITAYFRKHFNLQNRTISGWALITADDEYHFYLNGEYIKGDDTGLYESVDRLDYIELSDFLKMGENVIAIDVTDFDNVPRNGLRFYMELESLPVEITSAAEKIRAQAAENVNEDQLRRVVILNKNRIVSP